MSQDLRDKIVEDALVNRKLMITGKIDDDLIDLVTMQIFKCNEEDDVEEAKESALKEEARSFDRSEDPIRIFINSPGGNVISSLSIISAIESSKTPVYTYGLGHASSAAALILLSGHKRFAQKYCQIMIHEMSYGVHGSLTDIKESYLDTKKLQKVYDEIITRKTKIKQQQLDEIYLCKKDWYLNSAEALKLKIVDQII